MNDKVTSDMQEFEKQLESSNVVDLDSEPVSRLSETEINSIDGKREFKRNVVPTQPEPVSNQQNMIKVQKNIVLAFISDATGCGAIRCYFPFS